MKNTYLNLSIPLILASKSPRRAQLLKEMELEFTVVQKEVDESFDQSLTPHQALEHIVLQKMQAFKEESEGALIVCADTMVCYESTIYGKPRTADEAYECIQALSNKKHQVLTGVGLQHKNHIQYFYESTDVHFRELEKEEIHYYIQKFKPYDKAGSYGIQEWIGHIGIEKIDGSYTNVMGLPTQVLFKELKKFMAHFSQLKQL